MCGESGWADLPETGDPALAEWLEGASCGPRVKALAVRAVYAAAAGASAERWRRDLLAEHPDASTLLAEAEECMRGAGCGPGMNPEKHSGGTKRPARAAAGWEPRTKEDR